MAELTVIAALMAAAVIYGMSAVAKLRSKAAYRAFLAGFAATGLVSRGQTARVATALAGAEAAVAGLSAAALAGTLLSGPVAAAVLTAVALTGAAALTAVLAGGVWVALRRGVTAPCTCFGSAGERLSGVHLARNATLLVVLVCGAACAGLGHGKPGLAAVALAAAAGGVGALLLARLDDVTALFGTAAR